MSTNTLPTVNQQVTTMAQRLNVDPLEMQNILLATIMPSKQTPTNEQFVSFLAVANEYRLNPLTKEIYAFPAKGGGIQAIVSIDGWLKIINHHPEFNGMVHEDIREGGQLIAITAKIYRKGLDHPVTVTEYLSECKGVSEPWQKWPSRMLRHKATIQAARYAFGLSGIIDPDEAERFEQAGAIVKTTAKVQKSNEAALAELPDYTEAQFRENLPSWQQSISSGRTTAETLVNRMKSKYKLTESMEQSILNLSIIDAEIEVAA